MNKLSSVVRLWTPLVSNSPSFKSAFGQTKFSQQHNSASAMSSDLEIVGKKIGPIGFGLMGLTWRETPPSQEQAFETMRAALANGCKQSPMSE
jgi:hypothetical protein